MGVTIVCEPRRVVSWDEFCKFPRRSIAVDGYCSGRPRYNSSRVILNTNHHEEVDRIATRSSCDQALCLVSMGLFEAFADEHGKPDATLYIEDHDWDVMLSTDLLLNPDHAHLKKMRDLVRAEDLMDMSAGLWPSSRRWDIMKQLAWIGEPYMRSRMSGALWTMDAETMSEELREMHRRLRHCLVGRAKGIEFDTSYQVLSEHDGWVMVKESGYQARIGMAEAGIKAFVSYKGPRLNNRHGYAIGRQSKFISWFALPMIYDWLNVTEGIPLDSPQRWGGGDTTGGSPQEVGSALTQEQVGDVVDAAVAYRRSHRPRQSDNSFTNDAKHRPLSAERIRALVEDAARQRVGKS